MNTQVHGIGLEAARLPLREREVTDEITATSFHASPLGGGVLIGRGKSSRMRRAVLSPEVATRDPEPGETWRVTGPEHEHPEYGWQIHASVALPLLPTGRTIIRYLATSPRFEGIGWRTANRLWETLDGRLYDAVAGGDVGSIARVIGAERAVCVIQGFGLLAEEVEVFRWLDRYGVSPRTAAAVADLWGRGAITRIEADPYALALLEPWRTVDTRALRLGLSLDDPRRLLAAVDEGLSQRYRLGHTAATASELQARLWSLLGFTGQHIGAPAIEMAVEAGRVIRRSDDLLQGRAAWFMEREIERMIADRLARETQGPSLADFEAACAEVERATGHVLSPRQREAVHMAVSSPVSVLCGGAGTGKTSSVKAVLAASERRRDALPPGDREGFEHPQVALAGRAAKRIAEATGREASTLARFLRRLEASGKPPRRGLAILDEASMLDVPSIYRTLVALPAEVDLLFVGDPGQLPPLGPGLPFHQMVQSPAMPKVTLDVVHRQTSATGIPGVAQAIREGRMPDLPRFDPARPLDPGVFILPASRDTTGMAALSAFRAMAGPPPEPDATNALHELDIQVLCALKNGPHGFRDMNAAIEAEWMARQPRIHDWGLSQGSKITWLRNDYSKAPLRDARGEPVLDPATGKPVCAGFYNGSLGIVRRETGRGAWVEFDDGAADETRQHDLEKLTLGWAISVHKAQGSGFRRVIVPIGKSRLLDRSLVYTAVTRGIETVVLVGDMDLLRAAIEAPPRAWTRRQTLNFDGMERDAAI
jgi:exodeoxyribonuclease V alpha subunit